MESTKNISTAIFKKIYNEFDRMILAKGYKTGNGTMYQKAVQEYLIWLEENNYASLLEINSNTCEVYYEFLCSRNNQRRNGTLSNTTINHHLFGLRIFIDHLWNTEQINHLVIIPPNHPAKKMDSIVLSREQISLLYVATENLMETALLSLAYGCGLRRQELCQLNWCDISFHKSKLMVRSGKGNKTREVPLSETVMVHLRDYSQKERFSAQLSKGKFYPEFLITQQGIPANGNHLNRLITKMVKRTTNDELLNLSVSLHKLRHAIATHLSENGAEIEFIRDFLGHETVDTASLYMIRRKRKSKYLI